MNSAEFQLHKVRRAIRVHGRVIQFVRQLENQFHEPTGETETVEFKALLHEGKGSVLITKQTADKSVLRSKPSTMLLAEWEDCKSIDHQWQAVINGKTYTIDGIHNLEEANLIADISLEEVQT